MELNTHSETVITGASGLLGINWALKACISDPVVMVLHDRHVAVPRTRFCRLDLNSPDLIREMLDQVRPARLIHTVGLTSVEACEQNPGLAYKINVSITANVAQACRDTGVKLVHISTDHLFDGCRAFAREDWRPKPLNVYGKTKAEAEAMVGEICNDALIIRTNFYGWGPLYRPSFSDTIIGALRRGQTLNLFDDVFYTPTLIELVIEAVNALVEKEASGIYNVVGDDRVSKYEFGLALAKVFSLDSTLIRRGSIEDMPQLVRRPRDMSLANTKLKVDIGRGLGSLDTHLAMLRNLENSGLNPATLR
jgi:dTDP-4-dehydrorhamnose reductase